MVTPVFGLVIVMVALVKDCLQFPPGLVEMATVIGDAAVVQAGEPDLTTSSVELAAPLKPLRLPV